MKIMNECFLFLTILGLNSCKKTEAPLPVEFNNYMELNSNFSSVKFEVILLSKTENYMAPYPIRIFYGVNEQLILEEDRYEHNDSDGYYYFKLDENANKIDSLFVRPEGGESTEFIKEYLVHTMYEGESDYNTWPLNGDKTKKKIEILNRNLTWSKEAVNKAMEEILAKADYYFYNLTSVTDDWYIKKVFYCTNHKWQVLYQKRDEHEFFYDYNAKEARRYKKDLFFSSNDESFIDASENYVLKHFQKEEKITYEHSIGESSQSFSVKEWVGTGYFNIPLLNDTLKIKKQNLVLEKGNDGKNRYYIINGGGYTTPFNLNIYTNSSLNYAIYSTSANSVYVIRKK